MKRSLALLAILFVAVALAACGGDDDGGDDAAPASTTPTTTTDDTAADDGESDAAAGGVCTAEESLVALDEALGGALPDFDGASTAIDELQAADDGALEEALTTLGDGVDRVSEAVDGIDLNDEDAVDEALAGISQEDRDDISTAADEIKAYVSDTCGFTIGSDDTTTDTSSSSSGSGSSEAGAADTPPSIDDAELAQFAQDCFDGDGGACDDLFFRADVGSAEEEYGNTCGGRFESSPGLCATAIGE